MLINDFINEFNRYRQTGEKALRQMSDDALNRIVAQEANSAAMLVRHLGGNLLSRFTDFLTTDGEKPWRHRDREFETRLYSRAEMEDWWTRGWGVLEEELGALTDADLEREVQIRGRSLTVHAALSRALAHVAYHIGQIVLLARMQTAKWDWISVPKGQSVQYNQNPTKEITPGA